MLRRRGDEAPRPTLVSVPTALLLSHQYEEQVGSLGPEKPRPVLEEAAANISPPNSLLVAVGTLRPRDRECLCSSHCQALKPPC